MPDGFTISKSSNDRPRCSPRRALIVAISSDIGLALARYWLDTGWQVCGTYRNRTPVIAELSSRVPLICCDLADSARVTQALQQLLEVGRNWDVVVLCPGTLDPVGPFIETPFAAWEESLRINFVGPLQLVQALLPARNRQSAHGPCVLFFSGSGTNGTADNYSAYTAAKIGLIKMCELLDAEVPDTRFAILGTGPVKTKIHAATLRAGASAGPNYQRVVAHFQNNNWTPMHQVLQCCDWIISSPRNVVSGRNFSVANDLWGQPCLEERLAAEPGMYKLRRFGNDWRPVAPASTSKGQL